MPTSWSARIREEWVNFQLPKWVIFTFPLTTEVRTLVKAGMAKQKIAEELGIGVASVYRILKS
jgi:hypothetical protein